MTREISPRKRWQPTGGGFAARRTAVKYASDTMVALKQPGMSIDIFSNGDITASYDSRAMAEEYMNLDEELTGEIQEDFEKTYERTGYIEWVKEWIQKRGWHLDSLGADNTYNWDSAYWWGGVFEYVHFQTPDMDEGAVIMWHLGGDPRGGYATPQVWMGGFEEFVSMQQEGDPHSEYTLNYLNEWFEGGIEWALRHFEEQGTLDLAPGPVLDMFEAMEERKVREGEEAERRRRIETERRLGQRYLWPELGP